MTSTLPSGDGTPDAAETVGAFDPDSAPATGLAPDTAPDTAPDAAGEQDTSTASTTAQSDATDVDATDVDATDVDATDVDATDVDATDVDATDVDATDVDATDVDATDVDATDVDATVVDATVVTGERAKQGADDGQALLGDPALDNEEDMQRAGADLQSSREKTATARDLSDRLTAATRPETTEGDGS